MLGEAENVTIEQFWSCKNLDGIDADGDAYLGADRWINFEKYIWFKLGHSMWKKRWDVFQYHFKYIHNDIMKPFWVGILQYSERVFEMYDLAK